MNYVFMFVMICFLFLAISIAIKCVTCFITSEILSNTLCKSNFTKEMKKKTIICGFISDLLSVVILPLILIIQNLLEYDSFLKFDDITIYNYIFYIFYIACQSKLLLFHCRFRFLIRFQLPGCHATPRSFQ